MPHADFKNPCINQMQSSFDDSDEDCIPPTPSPIGGQSFLTLRKHLSSSGSEDEQSVSRSNVLRSGRTIETTSAQSFSKVISGNEGSLGRNSKVFSTFPKNRMEINTNCANGLENGVTNVERSDDEDVEERISTVNFKPKTHRFSYMSCTRASADPKESKSPTDILKPNQMYQRKDENDPKHLLFQTDVDDQVMKKVTSKTYKLGRKNRLTKVVSNPLKSSKMLVSTKRSPEFSDHKREGATKNEDENGSVFLAPTKCVLSKSKIKSVKRSATKGSSPSYKRHQSTVVPQQLKVQRFNYHISCQTCSALVCSFQFAELS